MANIINLEQQQVSNEEFKVYSGKDLSLYLTDSDNPSNEVEAFLYRKQLSIDTFIKAKMFKQILFDKMTDDQKLHYKVAIMEQIIYEMRNGEISSDSGYDEEIGAVANIDYLTYISIAPLCKQNLECAGLWSRKVKGTRVFDAGDIW